MDLKMESLEENCASSIAVRKSVYRNSSDNGKKLIEITLKDSIGILSTELDHKDIHKST